MCKLLSYEVRVLYCVIGTLATLPAPIVNTSRFQIEKLLSDDDDDEEDKEKEKKQRETREKEAAVAKVRNLIL